MSIIKSFKKLCSPALFYFTLSIFGLFVSSLQNIKNTNKYDLGHLSCSVPNTFILFVIQLVYILFWTWILNLICKDGFTWISWILVLFPFILLFIVIFMFFKLKN